MKNAKKPLYLLYLERCAKNHDFYKIPEIIFSRKSHFREIIAFPIGNQWFWRSFSHFPHFCEKVRKVAPFWPKSKSSEKRCRFYHAFFVISALLRKSAWRTHFWSGTVEAQRQTVGPERARLGGRRGAPWALPAHAPHTHAQGWAVTDPVRGDPIVRSTHSPPHSNSIAEMVEMVHRLHMHCVRIIVR